MAAPCQPRAADGRAAVADSQPLSAFGHKFPITERPPPLNVERRFVRVFERFRRNCVVHVVLFGEVIG